MNLELSVPLSRKITTPEATFVGHLKIIVIFHNEFRHLINLFPLSNLEGWSEKLGCGLSIDTAAGCRLPDITVTQKQSLLIADQ